jgi:hypothetical protein
VRRDINSHRQLDINGPKSSQTMAATNDPDESVPGGGDGSLKKTDRNTADSCHRIGLARSASGTPEDVHGPFGRSGRLVPQRPIPYRDDAAVRRQRQASARRARKAIGSPARATPPPLKQIEAAVQEHSAHVGKPA